MAQERRGSVAFYSSGRFTPLRRHSEPAPSVDKVSRQDTGSDVYKPFRRYSFSVLEDLSRFKRLDVGGGNKAKASGVDLSSASIRGRVERVLEENGFKDAERAKVKQFRRYSTHLEAGVKNYLGARERRGSFGATAAALHASTTTASRVTYCTDRNVGLAKTFPTGKYMSPSKRHDLNKSEMTSPTPRAEGTSAEKQHKIAWGNSPDGGGTPEEDCTLISGAWHTRSDIQEADKQLLEKKSMWQGRCRRDSLTKLRNNAIEALRPKMETSTEYWRRCRSLKLDNDASNFPRCRYRLRENGLIASELANASKVDIYDTREDMTMVRCRPVSASADVSSSKVLYDLVKRRRRDGSKHESLKDDIALPQRPMSSLSESRGGITPDPTVKPSPMLHRSMSNSSAKSQTDNAEPELEPQKPVKPQARLSRQFTLSNFKHIASVPGFDRLPSRCQGNQNGTGPTRQSPLQKRRWSQTPTAGFELIGSTALHGTPGYTGRLMLLTARTVRFHDGFQDN